MNFKINWEVKLKVFNLHNLKFRSKMSLKYISFKKFIKINIVEIEYVCIEDVLFITFQFNTVFIISS